MNKIIIGLDLVWSSLILVGYDKVGNSSHIPYSNQTNQTNQTQIEYTPCRFNKAVSTMVDNLRNQPGYLDIEYRKRLYLETATDELCNAENLYLKQVLRAVWQQSVNDDGLDGFKSCNTACGLRNSISNTNSNGCYHCKTEMNDEIAAGSQAIQNFFSSN